MAYQGEHNAPAPSPTVGGWLQGWLCKAIGLAMLLGCIAIGMSLVTWSITDPSFTRTTSAATRNAVGPVGAIVSDLLMQTLGMAAVLFVLPPLFWALQMMTQGRLDRFRAKLVMAPAAILLIAGALAALPQIPEWPIHYGMGGFLGYKVLNLAAGVLGFINPARAALAASLIFLIFGVPLLTNSLGLTQQDIRMIFDVDVRAGFRRIAAWAREMRDVMQARGEPMLHASASGAAIEPAEHAGRAEPTFGFDPPRPAHTPAPQPAPVRMAPRVQPTFAPAPVPAPIPAGPKLTLSAVAPRPEPMLPEPPPAVKLVDEPAPHDDAYLGTHRAHEPSFDHVTDAESLKIARRFAPSRFIGKNCEFSSFADRSVFLCKISAPEIARIVIAPGWRTTGTNLDGSILGRDYDLVTARSDRRHGWWRRRWTPLGRLLLIIRRLSEVRIILVSIGRSRLAIRLTHFVVGPGAGF